MVYREYRVLKVHQDRWDRQEKWEKRVFLVFLEFQDLRASVDHPGSLVSKVIPDHQVNQANRVNPALTGLQVYPGQLVNLVSKVLTVSLVPRVWWEHQAFLVLPDFPGLLDLPVPWDQLDYHIPHSGKNSKGPVISGTTRT